MFFVFYIKALDYPLFLVYHIYMNIKKSFQQYKFIESIALSVVALGIYNFATQFVLYPFFNRRLGDEVFGDLLTILSVLSVLSMSVGVGANYSRMACKPRFETENGDYNRFLCFCIIPVAVIPFVSLFFFDGVATASYIFLPILSVAMMLRYYAEVDFRLETNYRKNFVFYIILTVGYFVGLCFFKLTKSWETAILTGELAAVLFVVAAGKIFRKPHFEKSEKHKEVIKSCFALSGSQLFSNLTLNADRLIIGAFSTGTDVTVYYTASLLGKAMALLTGPVSGVLIGFLAKAKSFGRKQFLLCSFASIAMGFAAFLVFIPLSPLIIGFLYPDTAGESARFFTLANGGQIVYFISNLLLVIVLRFAKEKIQLYINIVYSIAFFAVSIPSVVFGNLYVFCLAIFILNLVRMASILLIGWHFSKVSKEITA